jgi:uracil-DNA glycosylase
MSADGRLNPSWQDHLGDYLASEPMQALADFLRQEKAKGKQVFPRFEQMFAAFNATDFEAVRVVILGQDPYHGLGQAHGLSFSVPDGVPPPPSLQNVFKELARDLGMPKPSTGNLTPWARQGVLLLNAVLSVEMARPGSHQAKGWEAFTDEVIRRLSNEREGLVFMLWGAYAQAKGRIIDNRRHCVLRAPHPSPLSAHRGFIGCGHFSATNRYLQGRGQKPIDWRLS